MAHQFWLLTDKLHLEFELFLTLDLTDSARNDMALLDGISKLLLSVLAYQVTFVNDSI